MKSPTKVGGFLPSPLKTLKSGSLTSVAGVDYNSGVGLLIPFGLSRDGLNIIDPSGVNLTVSELLGKKRVIVAGNNVVTEAGAVVDLRGGGDLYAYQWVSGIGGPVDLLGETSRNWTSGTTYESGDLVLHNGQTWSARLALSPGDFSSGKVPEPSVSRYWTLVPETFAVVPGYSAAFAPYALFNSGENSTKLRNDPGYIGRGLQIGDQIHLDAGSGLASGTYTLLPRRYAVLPGAYLVTPQAADSLGMRPYGIPEGSAFVTGYRYNALNKAPVQSALRSFFEVAPASVVSGRASYQTLGISDFIDDAARQLVDSTQVRPRDSGYLSLQANAGMSLGGSVLSPSISGGRGVKIDISSSSDIYILGSTQSAPSGAIALNSSTLSGFGAESLMIGGIRISTADGVQVNIRSSRVVLDNAGASLQGEDVALVSLRDITLAPGSVMSGGSTAGGMSDPFLIKGDGVVVRAGSGGGILREGFTTSSLPSLTVGAGARVAGGSVTLDSTYAFDLDPTAIVSGSDIGLGAGQISLLLGGPATLSGQVINPHLVIAGDFLNTLQTAEKLSLLAYQQSLDIYGPGTFGGPSMRMLSLAAGEIRGFDQGSGTSSFAADDIVLSKSGTATAPGPVSAPSGTLRFVGRTIAVAGGDLAISQFSDVALDASDAIELRGDGSLSAQFNLTASTPSVFAQKGAKQALLAGGQLNLLNPGGGSAVTGGMGGSLRLQGTGVSVFSDILLPSGLLEITATGAGGNIEVGGSLNLSGTSSKFYDLERYTDGGDLRLRSNFGNVSMLATSKISVAATAGGGNAGTIAVHAENGGFSALGTFAGNGGPGGNGGSFSLDTKQLASLDDLRDLLNTGGFTESREVRVRQGDLVVAGGTVARNYVLSADGGDITVRGTIDASGATGGTIDLLARGSLILEPGALLSVKAQQFNSAGKGGAIRLEAGSSSGGSPNLSGTVDIQAGSKLDLSVAAYRQGATALPNGDYTDPTSSAFQGKLQGTLGLRAPQIAGNTDVGVGKISGEIVGASAILVEGYRVYTPAGGVMNIALRNLINTDAQSFIAANEGSVGVGGMRDKLIGGTINAALDPLLVLAPGAEIINATGDLILGQANLTGSTNAEARTTADWDLSTYRYGTRRAPGVLTLRAAGDIYFNNALSDGFTAGASTSSRGNTTMWLATQQAIDRDGSGNLLRPLNTQSWSYRITAGADVSASDVSAVNDSAASGSVFVGELHSVRPNPFSSGGAVALGDDGLTANTIRISTSSTDQGTRYEVIRTGTGSITISAARDVQLRNMFATIYTAGVRLPAPQNLFEAGDFAVPQLPAGSFHPDQGALGAIQQPYGPTVATPNGTQLQAQYAMAGGNVEISAGQNIGRYAKVGSEIVNDSSRQLPNNWLYRRGQVDPVTGLFTSISISGTGVNDVAASTTWWVDYSNFFEGIGTLGGGNIALDAGGNIENIDAVAPTNARMAGRGSTGANIAPDDSKLVELGGGDVRAVAGANIDGGVYYVERGNGILRAGGEITTNAARSPSFGYLANPTDPNAGAFADRTTWLPTTLFVGKGGFDVKASGDVLLGPVVNTFWLPQGLNNKFWYKTYFNTFAPESYVNAASIQGDVNFRTAIVNSGGAIVSPLFNWLSAQNRFSELGSPTAAAQTAAYYQPWIRLAETSVTEFADVTSILPPTVRATSFSGDINLLGSLNLFPSATGTLELSASGSINGLQGLGSVGGRTAFAASTVNVSDADPESLYGLANPNSSVANSLSSSSSGFLALITSAFSESGSSAGADASIGVKGPRHASFVLHAADTNPLRVFASSGDISGLTLFAPKQAYIAAGNDIADIAFYLQNASRESISVVSAGGDLKPFDESSLLRAIAQQGTNFIINAARSRIDGSSTTALAGDIQISGEGVLEVLAGGNIDLGSSEKFQDGTGAGITSIGRARNPFLPFQGAELFVLAGVKGLDGGAALGLTRSALKFAGAGSSSTGGGIVGTSGEHDALRSLLGMFDDLKEAAKNSAETGSYESGYAAIAAIFGASSQSGEIFTRTRDIRTTSGGGITIAAPGGGVTMASSLSTTSLTPPGIVTEFGGAVSIFMQGSLDIGATRVFTLRGGDLTIWSSEGNIAAGTTAKTVVTAPPTRVSIDATSAELQTDLGGLATGGGIGVLAAVEGVEPGAVTLIAPKGTVDAGDAGIRATGNINIAAATVLNADNITSGGTSTGVPSAPTVAAPNVSGLSSGSSSTAAASSAANSVSNQATQAPVETIETPSIITVEVLGYGGGEEDEGEG